MGGTGGVNVIETSADDRARGRESSAPPTLDLAHHFGTPDVVVGQFRPGSDGHNPPRVSIAIEINASGL